MQPNLYMIHYGQLAPDALARIIEHMMAAIQRQPGRDDRPPKLREIAFVHGPEGDACLEAFERHLQYYPALANKVVRHVSTRAFEGFGCAELVVFTPDACRSVEALYEAVTRGIPALIPDCALPNGSDLRDGIDVLHYRANDAGSLLLSLLAVDLVPRERLARIAALARQTLSKQFAGLMLAP